MGKTQTATENVYDGTTDYKPIRSKSYNLDKVHISDKPMTWSNWYQHVNWINSTFVVIIPFFGFIASYWVPLRLNTAIFAFIFYVNSGLGITAGYHRLWAHRAYQACLPLRLYLALCGASAIQGSIRWWSKGHRAHHRYTDTNRDPYDALRGFMHSHMGWMVWKQNPKRLGRTDITDLNEDPLVIWQHTHYLKIVVFMAYIFPTLVCGLGWGDYLGGFIYAGLLKVFWIQQATFCVNSLAHMIGDQPYDDRRTPRDHFLTAIVTLGEGYHNFHHEFPSDYRNAILWWQFDPTKWSIWTWKQLGLAYNLQHFPQNEIEKGVLQQKQKKLDRQRASLDWGTPLEDLPVMDWEVYVEQVKAGKDLVAIAGVVHDITKFIAEHPGGKALIKSGLGKDATAIFNGGVYNHSNAAHNLLSTMRVGVLRGGGEVEVLKRNMSEKEKGV
ncbi:unnamed protein product [Clonostachys rhizophaga]|uniref:Acyl-CoA desaturase n=1 Tax=Clonostachys rhizophaga TaxID=160324 RepID=A0A9N9YRW2_9HYPO|nr:unnamed protein product [Clonostachys rhizophaga]